MEPIRAIGLRDRSVARIDGMTNAARSGERDADGRRGDAGPRRDGPGEAAAPEPAAPAAQPAGEAGPGPVLIDVRA